MTLSALFGSVEAIVLGLAFGIGEKPAYADLFSPPTIAELQTSLDIAICRQQWETAIYLTSQITGYPRLTAKQRQSYVALRHTLENWQSRSNDPDFVINFEDPSLPESLSRPFCEAVPQPIDSAPPIDAIDPASPAVNIDWEQLIYRQQTVYSEP